MEIYSSHYSSVSTVPFLRIVRLKDCALVYDEPSYAPNLLYVSSAAQFLDSEALVVCEACVEVHFICLSH